LPIEREDRGIGIGRKLNDCFGGEAGFGRRNISRERNLFRGFGRFGLHDDEFGVDCWRKNDVSA